MDGSPTTYVIGASGYVGSAVITRLAAGGISTVGTYHSSESRFGQLQYDFWADEPLPLGKNERIILASTVERDDKPVEKFERRVRSLCERYSENRLVYLSTDAVFGGETGQYSEDAPPRPTGTYGRRTARFENLIREICSNYCIIRPSYVYGFSGGVLDNRLRRTLASLRANEEIQYYDDYFKSPIEVNQLAEVVCRVYKSEFCGTLHAGGPRVSAYQFHQQAASAFGASTDSILPEAMPEDSPLPRDTSLDTSRLNREFGLQPEGIVESLACSSVSAALTV